jgi:hypothetical protein
VTTGTPQVIEHIKSLLERMVPVHEVHDLTVEGPSVQMQKRDDRERGDRGDMGFDSPRPPRPSFGDRPERGDRPSFGGERRR